MARVEEGGKIPPCTKLPSARDEMKGVQEPEGLSGMQGQIQTIPRDPVTLSCSAR